MTTKTNVTDDLRSRLGNAESRQQELLAERGEIAFAATVEKQKAAVQRLETINNELSALANEISVLEAALKEAHRRDVAAAEAERAEKRKANVAAAAEMLLRAEDTAALLTKAMDDMRSHSLELQRQFAEIRGLIGVGATDQQLRVFLTRCVKTATMNTPMHLEHLAPNERTDVNAVVVPWAASIRNWINSAVGEKPAKAA
jgi:hypothetical protein